MILDNCKTFLILDQITKDKECLYYAYNENVVTKQGTNCLATKIHFSLIWQLLRPFFPFQFVWHSSVVSLGLVLGL